MSDNLEAINRLAEENKKLKKFARFIIEDECFDLGGLQSRYGGDVQGMALELGLIVQGPATREDVEAGPGSFEEGDVIFHFSDMLKEE